MDGIKLNTKKTDCKQPLFLSAQRNVGHVAIRVANQRAAMNQDVSLRKEKFPTGVENDECVNEMRALFLIARGFPTRCSDRANSDPSRSLLSS